MKKNLKLTPFLFVYLFTIITLQAQNDPTADRWEDNGTNLRTTGGFNGNIFIGDPITVRTPPTNDRFKLNVDAGSNPFLMGLQSSAPNPLMYLKTLSTDPNSSIAFGGVTRFGWRTWIMQWKNFQSSAEAGGNVSDLVFNARRIGVGGGGSIDWVTFKANGRVGIGEDLSNPTAQLHTTGTVRFQDLIDNVNANRVVVADGDGNLFTRDIAGLGGNFNNNCTTTNFLPKVENTSGDLVCSIVFDDGTNVGIGTTTPTSRLEVDGDIRTNQSFIASDKRYKRDIQPLSSALTSLSQLRGVSYAYNSQQFSRRSFPQGKSMGFIAQEVEAVFPELVQKNAEGYLAVNYDGLIPVLVEGMKEQQALIEQQQKAIEALEVKVNQLTSGEKIEVTNIKATLYQNKPNPFNVATQISYQIANDASQANLYINDLQGNQIKHITIDKKGKGEVTIQANELKAGMYIYTLIVDGEEVDTKRMILTK